MGIDERRDIGIVASAPGKVLISGGYLILEKPNTGIVLSTTSRFYSIVKPLSKEINPDSWAWAWTDVRVTSPQLHWAAEYKLSLNNSTVQQVSSRDQGNAFVEQSLQYVIAASQVMLSEKGKKDALQKLLLRGLDITILGSNDFYSFRSQIEARDLPLTLETLDTFPPFSTVTCSSDQSNGRANQEQWKPDIAKTGLGSSAAMTTALCAALLHYLGVVDIPFLDSGQRVKEECQDLDLIHIVAQTAHCIAQGKIGSGFDVSAAVYGSQRYVRFSPEVLSSVQLATKDLPLQEIVRSVLKGKWDQGRSEFSLPPMMKLIIGQPGTGGSSTPSMVGAVMQWKMSNPQISSEIWKKLAAANSRLEDELNKLCRFARERSEAYTAVVGSCSCQFHEKWVQQARDQCQETIINALMGARDAVFNIRSLMQFLGKAANVPIEPESQTCILDATMALEGVLFAAVPGAGGFDAVFAIALGQASAHVSRAWSALGVLPMLVSDDPRGVCLERGDPRVSL